MTTQSTQSKDETPSFDNTTSTTTTTTTTTATTALSQAPSHILQDGRFVILPDPSPLERRRYVERSIARHGLLQKYMKTDDKEKDGENNNETTTTTTQGLDGKDAGETAKQTDDKGGATKSEEEDGDDGKSSSQAPAKVHPLVLASARLGNDGINELNRSINLSTLVQTGEYFSMSNIVADSALEMAMTEAATAAAADSSKGTTGSTEASKSGGGDGGSTSASESTKTGSTATGAAAKAAATAGSVPTAKNDDMHQSQRIAAAYILKRKYAHFRQSAGQLQQHCERLKSAIVAEHRPLNRLRQLRTHWRLVAPEHGTRAAPHATRPTEVLAVDVDLYHHSSLSSSLVAGATASSVQAPTPQQHQPGRLARRVPRYATVELKSNYRVDLDTTQWKKKMKMEDTGNTETKASLNNKKKESTTTTDDNDVAMKNAGDEATEEKRSQDDGKNSSKDKNNSMNKDDDVIDEDYSETALWTRAEPFSIADPTLGKIDADFDPSKVAMLTLEFAIEKPSTGFCISACLQPLFAMENTTTTTNPVDNTTNQDTTHLDAKAAADTQVLVALQHSLFCSKMFDSIRREVASDTKEVGQVRTMASQSERSTIWVSSQNELQFLPTPGAMVKGDLDLRQPVSVVHCHEGEVMVQLDCEYTLRIKLVEAANDKYSPQEERGANGAGESGQAQKDADASGAHTRSQLLALCRSLMLYAQEIFHAHSLHQDKLRKEEEKERESTPTSGFALKRKDREETSPRILQSCICLGSKILMERRIRQTLESVQVWLASNLEALSNSGSTDVTISTQQQKPRRLHTEWLSLSALDPHAQFTTQLTGTNWYVDVHLYGDRLTVTSFQPPPPLLLQQQRHASSNNIHDHHTDALDHYRKVDFHSDMEFELFLKRALRRQLQQST